VAAGVDASMTHRDDSNSVSVAVVDIVDSSQY